MSNGGFSPQDNETSGSIEGGEVLAGWEIIGCPRGTSPCLYFGCIKMR